MFPEVLIGGPNGTSAVLDMTAEFAPLLLGLYGLYLLYLGLPLLMNVDEEKAVPYFVVILVVSVVLHVVVRGVIALAIPGPMRGF